MPLPDSFYDSHGREVTLVSLCRQEPSWAASRIRDLHKEIDDLIASQQAVKADANKSRCKCDLPESYHCCPCYSDGECTA